MFASRSASALLAVVCLFGSSLFAQAYTRVQTSGNFVERTGTRAAATLVGDANDGAYSFALPFNFAFFDRVYSHCFMNTNGQVAFSTTNVTGNTIASLASPVATAELREAINVFRSDLAGHDLTANFGIYVESDRVVLQWREVGSVNNAGAYHMRFQCHLLQTGVIEIHYGGETILVDQDLNYVSGIVNASGTTSVAGFNNILLVQTTRPTAGQIVTFTPSGFAPVNAIDLAARSNANPGPLQIRGGTDSTVVGQFKLSPRGTGGVVTSINVRHPFISAADDMTLWLYRDGGSAGVLDRSDVPIGGGGQTITGTSLTPFAVTESIVGMPVNYLIVLDVGTITNYYQREANADHFFINPTSGDIATSVTASGGYASEIHEIAPGAVIKASVSSSSMFRYATAGQDNVNLCSFELRTVAGFGFTTVTSIDFNLLLTGISLADIAEARLYRDSGFLGAVDSQDLQISPVQSNLPSTSLTFNCSQYIQTDGQDFLLVCRVDSTYSGNGTIAALISGFSYSTPSPVTFFDTGTTGDVVNVTGTGFTVIVNRNDTGALTQYPAAATSTNNPAVSFDMRSSVGSVNVTSLVFRGNTTGMSAARLYSDTGPTLGRFDATDVQIGLPGVIVSGVSGSITFTPAIPIVVSGSVRNFLLVVDFTSAAVGDRSLSLVPADVITAVPVSGVAVGATMSIQAGGANGVNITAIDMPSTAFFGGSQMVVIATVQLSARGTGGNAPLLIIEVLDGAGGTGSGSGLRTVHFIEGAGPLGQLDSSDMLLNHYGADPFGSSSSTILANGTPNSVTGLRNLLICVRRESLPADGNLTLVFRGFVPGTDTQWTTTPGPLSTRIAVANVNVDDDDDDEEDDDDDDDGCTTGERTAPWMMLAALFSMMLVAARLRRA